MINKEKSIDFLLKEYSEAYTHMRHYDNISISFVKFLFTFDLAALSAFVAIYNYFDEKQAILIKPIGYLLILSFLIGVLLLSLAVRNRAYFVPVTRQVNRIRKYFKENMEIEFNFGDMYINPAYPKYFNVFSTYSLTFYLLSLLNSVIISVGFSCLFYNLLSLNLHVFITAFLLQATFAILYLTNKEKKSADEAIHGEK